MKVMPAEVPAPEKALLEPIKLTRLVYGEPFGLRGS